MKCCMKQLAWDHFKMFKYKDSLLNLNLSDYAFKHMIFTYLCTLNSMSC